MVPCKTVMQIAMRLRTDSSGTGKLKHNLYNISGLAIRAHSPTVNPSTIRAYVMELLIQCLRTLGLGLG